MKLATGLLFLLTVTSMGAHARLNPDVSEKSQQVSENMRLAVDLDRLCMHVIEGRRPFVVPGKPVSASLRELLKAYDQATQKSVGCQKATLGSLPKLMKVKGIADSDAELSRIASLEDWREIEGYLAKEYPALGAAESRRIAKFISELNEESVAVAAATAESRRNNQNNKASVSE